MGQAQQELSKIGLKTVMRFIFCISENYLQLIDACTIKLCVSADLGRAVLAHCLLLMWGCAYGSGLHDSSL